MTETETQEVAQPETDMAPVISITTNPRKIPFEVNGNVFVAWKIPGLAFLSLLEKLNESSTGNEQAAEMFRIFQSTMDEATYTRFQEFALNPSNGVDADVLLKLIQSLVEESSGRPTEPPSSSDSTQDNTAPTSGEAS